jgi:hypothetical protein
MLSALSLTVHIDLTQLRESAPEQESDRNQISAEL